MDNQTLMIQAALDNDSGKPAKITGVAYSGGTFAQMWDSRPLVLDLAGLELAPQIPLMVSHEYSPEKKLGEVKAEITDNQLVIEGEICSETAEAKEIIAMGKKSSWQLSIGADIVSRTVVNENDKIDVNGRTFTGPLIVVSRAKLREVSVVALGADENTSMQIAASFALKLTSTGENEMNEDALKPGDNVPVNDAQPVSGADITAAAESAIKAERARVAEIKDICAGDFPEIEAEAVKSGWDTAETRQKVLEALRANRPAASFNIAVPNKDVTANAIECGLCLRSGVQEDTLLKKYGEQTVEAAEKCLDLSLKDVVREVLSLSGQSYRTVDNSAIRAAFSTTSLPGILSNVANKVLLNAYNNTPIAAFKVCSTGNLSDFKESERYRMTDVGDLKPVGNGGEIKSGSVTEEKATNKLETYAKSFSLTRQMIINDDLGAFTKIPAAMGNRAARLIDQLFFARLTANPVQGDGNALFHAKHKNLLTGADSALSRESLQAGIAAMLEQKDADGQPIIAEARTLVVPTALKFTALELLKGISMVASSAGSLQPIYNALTEEQIEVVSSPYLTANSATAWYLFANPQQVDTFEIGFYNGKKTPTIEQGETDFNTLGIWYRVYFDLGIREQDYRGVFKAAGA